MTVAPDETTAGSPAMQHLVGELALDIKTKAADYADKADAGAPVTDFLRDILEIRRGFLFGLLRATTEVEE